MKVLINCSNLKKGGGLQVAHSFISNLIYFTNHDWYVVASTELLKQLNVKLLKDNSIHVFQHDTIASVLHSITGKDKKLAQLEKTIAPEVVFTVFGPSYWKPKNTHLTGFAKPQYIYYDSPFFRKISVKKKLFLKIKEFLHLHDFDKYNNAIVTESENVTERVSRFFPGKKVFTVSNTYNQVFDHPEQWDKTEILPSFEGTSLLTVSANYPHKNLNIIPGIIDILNKKYPLFQYRFILTLNPDDIKGLLTRHLSRIVFLGKVSVKQCPYLYQQADFMFLPTLLECFSASYPEAMKMETPILTSDLPFAHGICHDAAEYFDPLSPSRIADTIVRLAKDKARIEELKIAGRNRINYFETAKSRTAKYIKILEQINETATSKF